MNIPIFPTVNASLNGLAAVFLALGWLAIKKQDKELHRKYMTAALVCSAAFLISYISYHLSIHGIVTRYQKEGILRFFYFLILLTHTPLAVAIVPFIFMAVRFALRGEFAQHAMITRWLLPVWMYVSVTGVAIYLMLYVF